MYQAFGNNPLEVAPLLDWRNSIHLGSEYQEDFGGAVKMAINTIGELISKPDPEMVRNRIIVGSSEHGSQAESIGSSWVREDSFSSIDGICLCGNADRDFGITWRREED